MPGDMTQCTSTRQDHGSHEACFYWGVDPFVTAKERYRALAERLVRELGSQEAAAAKLGVSQGLVSKVLDGTRTPGRGSIQKAIELLNLDPSYFYGSDDTLPAHRVVAPGSTPGTGSGSSPRRALTEAEPRYPNLEAVLRYCLGKSPDRWSEATIAAARARQLKADGDPSVDEWERYLDGMEAVIRGFEETGSFGVPADQDEFTPPSAGRGRKK